MSVFSPEEKVKIARNPGRPGTADFIDALFTDFFEQRGDRFSREDGSILGGIARFHGRPVTVVGHRKGKNLEENLRCNFGMPGPEGYRKAQRLMKQAEKFGRPIITFIDTPGAYPGKEAEERGQAEAIARCLALMSALTVPVIAIVTGEGGSGGALALGVADRVLMLESCSHHVSCEDIGRHKIPRWLRERTGKRLEFDFIAGLDAISRPVTDYAMIIQCGGCMITARQLRTRLRPAIEAGVPVSNYGMTIAYLHGIFQRAMEPFGQGRS